MNENENEVTSMLRQVAHAMELLKERKRLKQMADTNVKIAEAKVKAAREAVFAVAPAGSGQQVAEALPWNALYCKYPTMPDPCDPEADYIRVPGGQPQWLAYVGAWIVDVLREAVVLVRILGTEVTLNLNVGDFTIIPGQTVEETFTRHDVQAAEHRSRYNGTFGMHT